MHVQVASNPPPALELPDEPAALRAELKRYLTAQREQLALELTSPPLGTGLSSAKAWCAAVDGLLVALWRKVEATMRAEGRWVPLELGAVGSYGRGGLSFHSDLDVRILCQGAPEAAAPFAEALLYPLWDAGVTIGHQVVTVEQMLGLAATDLPTATTLLDWRPIAGANRLAAEMFAIAFEGMFGIGRVQEFLDRLELRTAEREERFGGSVYLLEPDVRNGPGGLRDLDVAQWVGRARWQSGSLQDLVRLGVLVPRERAPIAAARSFIWRVRNLLHLQTGRRMDRLSFDRQESVAEQLGLGTGAEAVERMMSEYYRHARTLQQVRETIFSKAQPPPTRKPHEVSLGRGLKLINGDLTLAYPGDLKAILRWHFDFTSRQFAGV
jgi:[protein-PII] uridylyltransferase